MDMLNLHDKGLTNAICNFGVGKLTEDKINILKIQGISGIDIFFDNDKAGQEGAEKNKAILELEEIPVRNLVLPSNLKDPGELTASQVIRFKEILYG
jgi:DNA primase